MKVSLIIYGCGVFFTSVPQKHKANQVRYNLARFVVSVYYGLQTCLNANIRKNHKKSNLDASGTLLDTWIADAKANRLNAKHFQDDRHLPVW